MLAMILQDQLTWKQLVHTLTPEEFKGLGFPKEFFFF